MLGGENKPSSVTYPAGDRNKTPSCGGGNPYKDCLPPPSKYQKCDPTKYRECGSRPPTASLGTIPPASLSSIYK